ncbi:SRPBCC domain-containing protein [Glycomyces sp. YM15]|uniref:SRPBCC family protein n=1 Tax=Glycomyces sp. YM15 TaxID=2800446 RepID=UPI001962B237|nr:SRPBCC domain-containing protein [Glycomyces sp. YM15]
MVDILHRMGAEHTTPERAYEVLTTLDGLSGWWTERTTGATGIGDVIDFRFERDGAELGYFDMSVVELIPGKRVQWEVVDGPPEWIGTRIHWDLRQEGDYTVVLFKHEGWREPVEFMHHCSTKWALFLMSLKQLLETGKGAPAPHDVRIDDWN